MAPCRHCHPAARNGTPPDNVRACLRANTLALTVSDTCDHIADACGTARNFVANDPDATASITTIIGRGQGTGPSI